MFLHSDYIFYPRRKHNLKSAFFYGKLLEIIPRFYKFYITSKLIWKLIKLFKDINVYQDFIYKIISEIDTHILYKSGNIVSKWSLTQNFCPKFFNSGQYFRNRVVFKSLHIFQFCWFEIVPQFYRKLVIFHSEDNVWKWPHKIS